jgi:hypothetical protein
LLKSENVKTLLDLEKQRLINLISEPKKFAVFAAEEGWGEKTPVFGMLKRNDKVCTQTVKNCSASENLSQSSKAKLIETLQRTCLLQI